MPSTADSEQPAESNGSGWRPNLRFWLGIVVQLTVPLSALAAAWIATQFEARASARSILNQREQADSQLRATMFGNLVNPIVGPQKDGEHPIDPVRYALLVKLLALNFSDHFEFGPLMENADDAVAATERPSNKEVVDKTRWELRSVAHRITDRQIAGLWEDKTVPCANAGAWEATVYMFGADYADAAYTAFTSIKRPGLGKDTFYYRLDNSAQQLLTIAAPDCNDVLTVGFEKPDWKAQTIQVQATRGAAGSNYPTDQFTFQVSPFSFPFSDNTLFSDGNRFALFMKDFTVEMQEGREAHLITLRLRWFPKAFYPPTERPAEQGAVQRQLKIGTPGS